MSAEIVLRTATMDDCPAVCRLLRELDEHHVRLRPDLFQSFEGPARPRERLARFIEEADGEIFLAEVGSDIVGVATIRVEEGPNAPMFRPRRRAVVDDLFVSQDFRRMGIGKRLLDRAVEWTRSRGIPSIGINVWLDNETGASFFAANGFEPLSQRMELRIDQAPEKGESDG